MASTERVTTVVAQALFQVAADGAASVVASSLDGASAEEAWLGFVRPHLRFAETNGALTYVVFPGGSAAVLRRTWDLQRPGVVETHALMGADDAVTAKLALSTEDWKGRPVQPPADGRLPALGAGDLWDPDAAERFRARALAQADLLAHSLAWLLQSPATPIGFVGCPAADRTAILWALREIAANELPKRTWTFATHAGAAGSGLDIVFFDSPPQRVATAEMIVIDLDRGQGASPQNEYRANALVYRYEYGVDPPGVGGASAVPAPPATVPDVAAMVPASPARSTLTFARWTQLVRGLSDARDARAVDGALVELEFAVANVDDRDDVRKALENEGWAATAIRRRVPAELREAIFDRVVQVAFGATGPSRVTASAREDKRRLAETSHVTDIVRAVARADAGGELADVLAKRWLTEQATAGSPERAGPGRFTRITGHAGPVRVRRFVLATVLLLAVVLGVFARGVLW
ncbi:hypothetical protein [Amycolatopsis sp. CA-128772]|uniref:hypothetical protein n=1 Tax=Amycolatopsis sp. CA-128772 TaxID=2073159 RepID=UPI000CD14377|nr:hypothetical protein [Amycolatopsis sp. CA-128772]